jgi:hypothetical protein
MIMWLFYSHVYKTIYATLDPFLGMVAMALSGYTKEKSSLWRDHCLQLCQQVCAEQGPVP